MSRSCARHASSIGLVLVALSAALACSAPGGQDESEVPEFGAAPPFGGGAPATQAGVAANPTPGGGVAGPSGEAAGAGPGGIPSAANGGPAAGAGGSAAAPPAQGAGGSSMVAAGGSANVGAAGGGGAPGAGTEPGAQQPAPASCNPGELFCEDFEGLPVGPLTGTVNGMRIERTVEVFEEPGRGRVLRVQAGTGYGNKSGFFLDDFVPPDNSFFGRAFIRVEQFPNTGGDHWVLFEATQAGGGGEQARPVGGQFSRWAPGSDGPSAGDWTDWEQSSVATNAGVYECVEWQLDGAGGNNDMLLWVNGTEARPLDRGNFQLPPVGRVWLGFVVYQMNQPPMYDVRFDDVVLSTARVGCD